MSSVKTLVPKWHPKINKFMAGLEARSATIKDVIVKPSFKVECINSGSTVINLLIGGSRLPDGSFVCPGYPRGRISEVFGRESSGKSTFAMAGMGQAIANGGCGLYVDLEHAIIDNYAMKLGCDFRSPDQGGPGFAVRVQPHTFEEAEAIVTLAALNGIDFIVIDSVAGLVPRREAARDTSDVKQKMEIADVPRMMSKWMPKLQAIIARTHSHVMFLNQTRDKIGAMGYTEEALKSTTGGNALKFWASIRMLLKPRQSTKASIWNPVTKTKEDVQISTDVEIKMIKNKIDAKQGHSGLVSIRYGVGIDELRTMLNVAEAYNIVKKGKNKKNQDTFTYISPTTGEAVEGVGIEKFRLAINGSAKYLQEMIAACNERIILGFKMIDDEQLADLAENAVSRKHDVEDEDHDNAEQLEASADEMSGPPEAALEGEIVETPDYSELATA